MREPTGGQMRAVPMLGWLMQGPRIPVSPMRARKMRGFATEERPMREQSMGASPSMLGLTVDRFALW